MFNSLDTFESQWWMVDCRCRAVLYWDVTALWWPAPTEKWCRIPTVAVAQKWIRNEAVSSSRVLFLSITPHKRFFLRRIVSQFPQHKVLFLASLVLCGRPVCWTLNNSQDHRIVGSPNSSPRAWWCASVNEDLPRYHNFLNKDGSSSDWTNWWWWRSLYRKIIINKVLLESKYQGDTDTFQSL